MAQCQQGVVPDVEVMISTLFAADHRAIDDELFSRLRAVFADDEILDLTLCCAVFLGLGRTLEVLGIDDNCPLDI